MGLIGTAPFETYLIFLALFSILAFWKPNAVLFMVLAAGSLVLGFASPDIVSSDTSTTPLDITITLALIAYGFLCAGYAFKLMFWKEEA